MNLRVTLSTGLEFDADLYANPVAADLATRLPVEAVFTDFNGVEKVAGLENPLRLRGVPPKDSPQPGEIGYYAPTRSLVLYYGTVGTWPGLVRIGRFDLPVDTLRDLPNGFTARFVRTEDD